MYHYNIVQIKYKVKIKLNSCDVQSAYCIVSMNIIVCTYIK